METFRFYKVTSGGKIVSGDWIEAASLDDAVTKVRAICHEPAHSCELWSGDKRRAAFPCDPKADGCG